MVRSGRRVAGARDGRSRVRQLLLGPWREPVGRPGPGRSRRRPGWCCACGRHQPSLLELALSGRPVDRRPQGLLRRGSFPHCRSGSVRIRRRGCRNAGRPVDSIDRRPGGDTRLFQPAKHHLVDPACPSGSGIELRGCRSEARPGVSCCCACCRTGKSLSISPRTHRSSPSPHASVWPRRWWPSHGLRGGWGDVLAAAIPVHACRGGSSEARSSWCRSWPR